MKAYRTLLASLFVGASTIASSDAAELSQLKVLYIGSERTDAYVRFLEGSVARLEAKSRMTFQANDAEPFDVVLLDWPQGPDTRGMRNLTSPLGGREKWIKPTVLLGSAGLNLAIAWKLKGASGCTCMGPLAYDLHEHEIFEQPFAIDRRKMVSIPTPSDFRAEIHQPKISVLPLVENPDGHPASGWCAFTGDFARYPDIEVFCGGVNQKTPTAAGMWRQGNLLHFGFELSPAEMNECGQQLLRNAIVYISRFTEDRPIAITPSIFAGPAALSRRTVGRWLRNSENPLSIIEEFFSSKVRREMSLEGLDRAAVTEWADKRSQFLHPNSAQQLEIDVDLMALGVPFDDPQFVDTMLGELQSQDPAVVSRAHRLLERYVPAGPRAATFDEWRTWWRENQPYAFASDAGDYRWYIDPIAKRRRVPSHKLRGPARADRK